MPGDQFTGWSNCNTEGPFSLMWRRLHIVHKVCCRLMRGFGRFCQPPYCHLPPQGRLSASEDMGRQKKCLADVDLACWCRFACDERWMDITRSIRLKGGMQMESLKQPTWCQLKPEHFSNVVQRASTKYPENILFTLQTPEGASQIVRTARNQGQIAATDGIEYDTGPRSRSQGYTIGEHGR